MESAIDKCEDEIKKIELIEKLEAILKNKANEQVATPEGQQQLQEEAQEAIEEVKVEVKKGGKFDKLKFQIGAGTLAALAALGGGMAIMGGGEKVTNTSGGEKVENVETEMTRSKEFKEFKSEMTNIVTAMKDNYVNALKEGLSKDEYTEE